MEEEEEEEEEEKDVGDVMLANSSGAQRTKSMRATVMTPNVCKTGVKRAAPRGENWNFFIK